MSRLCIILLLTVLFIVSTGRKGIGGFDQDWGYITVRPNAHMFWWLYYTTYNNASNYTDRPLIIWLQGGPGMPSSGYGNLLEIGPLDTKFQLRNGSFIENFNVLFIDNPVGVGFSYVSNNETKLPSNGHEIGKDLYNFLKIFLEDRHPEFKNVSVYVFGESYGGKMATDFVYYMIEKESEILCNLKALALGDAYISPLTYINNYAPMALHLGLVDKRGFTRIDELAKQIQLLFNKKEYKKAADIENTIITQLYYDNLLNVDLHNILDNINCSSAPSFLRVMKMLEDVMNNRVKSELNITENVYWDYSSEVYSSLKGDLLKSVTDKIETILNTTNIKIIVYSGILDFIVNTAGTITWMDDLNWKGKERWLKQTQSAFTINNIVEGYSKKVDNLVFYAVLRSGHSVPLDNLPVMNEILKREILDNLELI